MKKISIDCWPRGMKSSVAATYVGLSESLFLAEVKKGRAPEPTWITRNRKVWLKEKLDDWLDRKESGMEVSETWSERTEKLRLSISSDRKRKDNPTS